MNARCTICLEPFGEQSPPLATRCGHLYCLDCATYNFAPDAALCAVCRRPQPLDALVRLYPDWEPRAGPSQSHSPSRARGEREGRGVTEAGKEILGACRSVLERGDVGSEALEPVLLNAECLAESVAEYTAAGDRPGVNRLLAALTDVLSDIRSKLNDVERLKEAEAEGRRYKTKYRNQRGLIDGLVREHEARQRQSAEQLEEQRDGWAQRAASLHQRLQSAHAGLTGAHVRLDAQKHELEEVKKEMEEWRAKSVRYKKKYHALQAQLAVLKNGSHTPPEDDSLVVV